MALKDVLVIPRLRRLSRRQRERLARAEQSARDERYFRRTRGNS